LAGVYPLDLAEANHLWLRTSQRERSWQESGTYPSHNWLSCSGCTERQLCSVTVENSKFQILKCQSVVVFFSLQLTVQALQI